MSQVFCIKIDNRVETQIDLTKSIDKNIQKNSLIRNLMKQIDNIYENRDQLLCYEKFFDEFDKYNTKFIQIKTLSVSRIK